MIRHSSVRLILVALATCVVAGVAAGQSPKSQDHMTVNGSNNESAKAELDAVAGSAIEDRLIIMIARLGSGESSSTLNWRRLKTARFYLENTRGVAKQRIVLAQGERVRGLGRVEVYVGCELFRIFTLARNEDFAKEQ